MSFNQDCIYLFYSILCMVPLPIIESQFQSRSCILTTLNGGMMTKLSLCLPEQVSPATQPPEPPPQPPNPTRWI